VGDDAYTLSELASEVSKQSGKNIVYKDLPEGEYAEALQTTGLPEPFAQLLANCDALAEEGALFDESKDLSRLLGRPTTSLAEAVRAAL
jgi:NAD(P)H dehydrogenase (quinone)